MLHRKQYSFGLIGLLLALYSCSEEITEAINGSRYQYPIELSGSISQENLTRANDYGFVDGDRMGIYIVDYENGQPGAISATENRASNVLFTYNDDGHKWSSPTTLYWRDEQTPIDVYGYYPGHNYIAQPTAWQFEVQSDQSLEAKDGDLSGYEQSDLLWGKTTKVSPTTEQIVVKYNHLLAGIRVHLNKGSNITDTEWDKLEKIVLVENTIRQATVNLSTGGVTVNTSEAATPVRMLSQSNDDYRAVVMPQKVAAGKQLLSITLAGQSYSHSLTNLMDYQGGKLHNFTMTVNKREDTGDYEIKVTDDGITPWINDEGSHQFSAKMYVTVNCPEMGKLKESITAAGYDYKTIQNLKVTGELTTEDFTLMRDEMPELKHLNLKNVITKHICYYDSWWDTGNHDGNLYRDGMIPNSAFYGNKSIRSLVLPSKLTHIGNDAFREMQLMYSTLEVPDGVTYIGGSAFAYNGEYNGMELILPHTIDSIGNGAFYQCMYKCELTLSDNIKYIGADAFGGWQNAGCWNFHGVFHIPSNLKELHEGAFSALGSDGSMQGDIEIPSAVTKIPDYLFGYYTTGMQINQISLANQVSLVIPNSVKEIGKNAFSGMRFKSASLGKYVEVLGDGAFQNARLPFEIELPQDLMLIGSDCFMGCHIEGRLEIPDNCLSLGNNAFTSNYITELVLPSKLEKIPSGCFNCCSELKQIVIPKYVNYIGDRAFGGCEKVQTVICLSVEPPILEGSPWGEGEFWGWHEGMHMDKVVLEVPEHSIELYRHTDGWKDFKNITAYHELAFNIPDIVCMDKGTTREGILRAEGDWEVSECPSWVTVSPSSGNYKEELTITVNANSGDTREGQIVFKLKGKDYTTYTTVRQVASADYKEDATVTLQTASAGGNTIPLFIVGEGYGADDIASGKYLTDMTEQMEHLFSTEPYKTYRNYFTVSTAYACSPQSGMGGLTKFNDNNDQVWAYTKAHGTGITDGRQGQTAILVLCNTKAYGNHTDLWDSGLSFSWIGNTDDSYPYDQRGEVLHHFGGRGFGKLGPEYVNHFTFMKACTCSCCNMTNEYNWAHEKGWWQNVSTTAKMTELPWYHLIFNEKYAQQVDVYEGALNHARSTYRSENQSVMGAAHVYYYNTISREEIVRRILTYAGETYSFDKFVVNDKMELPGE